jgi:branched-chain amino acid transport system substrate-binding protein
MSRNEGLRELSPKTIRRRLPLVVAMCVVPALGLAACGGSSSGGGSSSSSGSSGSSGGSFVVGAVEPESGTYGAAGLDIVHALKAEAAIINARGGILGKKIQVIAVDDASDPEKAISATQQLVQSHTLNMFEPDVIYGQTQLPLVSNLLSVNICAAPECSDGAKYPLNYSLNPPATSQVPSVLAYAAKHGDTKVGILATTDAQGQAFTSTVTADAKAAGVTISGTQSFDPTATDVSAELQSLKGSGAQAVLAWAAGTTVGVVMKGMQSLGWNAPVIGTPTVFTAPVASIVPAAVSKQLICLCYRVGVRSGSTVAGAIAPLVAGMKQFGPIASMQVAGLTADTLSLAAYGYTKAGSLNAKAAAAAIDKIGSDSSYPAQDFYGYRSVNPDFHGTVHSPADANLGAGFFSAATVSPLVEGTYEGTPFTY